MELVERAEYLQALKDKFTGVDRAGHSVFLMGEAGIGKTSLVTRFKEVFGCFSGEINQTLSIVFGNCAALCV